MARIRKSKYKDVQVKIMSACNDWFMVQAEQIPPQASIVSPTNVALSYEELVGLLKDIKLTGRLFKWFLARKIN